ncbi:TcfC E-set like domain-containing protein [Caedibacter taeniospiralis]|uniref:TcfC E-set like domain-containing protein n=1 Tax=Caedibacter taeniospiralis TaxID=28907 RepID=UPI000C2773DF|nr:TcfC E-set like domain-containing protein [Caedibacter taeniospiralis]
MIHSKKKRLCLLLGITTLCPLFLLGFSPKLSIASDLPPGFEDFVEEDETSLVTIMFGKEKLLETPATFNDDKITFNEPDLILSKLKPYISKTAQHLLLEEITQTQKTNADRLCTKGPNCGFVRPQVFGVIFDRNNYRAHIFINPKYLLAQDSVPAKFLKDSTAGFGVLNLFQLGASGNNDQNQSMALNHNGYLGYGNWHLDYKDNLTYSLTPGQPPIRQFQFRDFDLNWRRKEYHLSLGLQDTVGTMIIPSLQIVGASLQTNLELLTNLNEQIATPVEVNIIVPSYVDVYRGNTLIGTQYFPPGNHFLDTQSFPSGAYILRLETRTLTNQTSNKQVYFIKTNALPLLTLPNYAISYGRLAEPTSDTVFPTLTDLDVLTLEAKQRLNNFFGIGEHLTMFAQREVLSEFMLMMELSHLSFYNSFALSNFGDLGVAFSIAGNISGVTLNTFFRQMWVKENNNRYINQYFEDTQTSNTNLGTSLSFRWHDINFMTSLSYAYVDNNFQHDFGFDVSKTFSLADNNDLTLSLSLDHSESNKSAFIQLSWNFGTPRGWYVAAELEGQFSQQPDQGTQRQENTKLNIGKEFIHADYQNDLGLSSEINHNTQYYSQYASTNNRYFNTLQQLNLAQAKNNKDVISYNIQTSTSFAYAPLSNWGISSSDNRSGVMIYVAADVPSKYTVYVDGKESIVINNNQSYFISMPIYQEHNIQVQTHEVTLSVPNNDRNVILYPGNVETIRLNAKPAILVMGNFISSTGEILSHAKISGGLEPGETDTDGFAQIDVLTGAKLILETMDGQKCSVNSGTLASEDGIAFKDEIVCTVE